MNKHKHFHSVIQFKQKKRLGTVIKLLTERDHVEVMRGTIEEAKKYCIKSGPAQFECGEESYQGKRNDLV